MSISAYDRALLTAFDWLATEEAAAFARDFGAPYYVAHPDHGLAYKYGTNILPIERAENGESINEVENSSHYFRSGDTPGQPSQYDDFDDGIEGAERAAAAAPMYHPSNLTARQRRISDRVQQVLALIKPKYAELLRARYFEGKTEEAIASDLGVTQQAVSSRLKTAHRNFVQATTDARQAVAA